MMHKKHHDEPLDLNLLRSFLTVARRGNLTRAAGELGLSQPAVTRQLQQLRDTLGVDLFERLGRSLQLTDAGRRLASEGERLLGRAHRLAEAVQGHARPGRGRLRIGASTTPGLYLLPPLIGRFHRRFPGVDLQYTVENTLRIEEKILRNDLDLGFVGGHLASSDLVSEALLDDEICCFAAASHPLAARSRLSPADLEGALWIVRERGSATRRRFESWLEAAGGKLERAIELQGPEAVKSLVRAGVGISFLSTHALRDDLKAKRLRRLRLQDMRLTRPVLYVHHADKHLSPAMEAFVSTARTALRGRRKPSG